MNPPTEEKTMEWRKDMEEAFGKEKTDELEKTFTIGAILAGVKTGMMDMDTAQSKMEKLLASSQDSFRRKVEEELLNDEPDEDRTDLGWLTKQHRDELRTEQRAKLKTLNK